MHAPYCRFHLRALLGLDVDTSTIPGAGRGLFSLVARSVGSPLVEYFGEVLPVAEIERRYPRRLWESTAWRSRPRLTLILLSFVVLVPWRMALAKAGAPMHVLLRIVLPKVLVWRSRATSRQATKFWCLTALNTGPMRTHPTSLSTFLTGSGTCPFAVPLPGVISTPFVDPSLSPSSLDHVVPRTTRKDEQARSPVRIEVVADSSVSITSSSVNSEVSLPGRVAPHTGLNEEPPRVVSTPTLHVVRPGSAVSAVASSISDVFCFVGSPQPPVRPSSCLSPGPTSAESRFYSLAFLRLPRLAYQRRLASICFRSCHFHCVR